jgi:hypothetical protein
MDYDELVLLGLIDHPLSQGEAESRAEYEEQRDFFDAGYCGAPIPYTPRDSWGDLDRGLVGSYHEGVNQRMKDNKVKFFKTITLWQPYATLIALGLKKFETRSWHPGNRLRPGEVLMIHAAKRKLSAYEKRLMNSVLIKPVLEQHGITIDNLPMGAIGAATKFIDAHPTEAVDPRGVEKLAGNYKVGRFAWELELVRCPAEPIPATGKQRIWMWKYEERE